MEIALQSSMSPASPNKAAAELPVRRWRTSRLLSASCAALVALGALQAPAWAQGQIKLVRDAETEALLRDYATPLLRVSKVGAGATRIFLINNRNFNAFVAGGRNIFMFAGTMMEAKTPNEVIGVMAHEIGHIAGSHIARQQMMMSKLGPVAIAAMLLGAGALAASTRSRNVGGSPIGIVGALTGPQEILRRAPA
jgi:predicted Zn-dependent protease